MPREVNTGKPMRSLPRIFSYL